MTKKYHYSLEFKVRDYECDLQGIVNNAVYQNYLEHTRHEYMQTLGLDFAGLHRRGTDLVVARIEMAFKTPLKSGDSFVSCLRFSKEGIKYIFEQEIFRLPDRKLSLKATVTAAAIVNGKLSTVPEIDSILPTDAADAINR